MYEKIRLLIIGGGGREHALAWKLAQSPKVKRILLAPGNGGTVEDKMECVSLDVKDHKVSSSDNHTTKVFFTFARNPSGFEMRPCLAFHFSYNLSCNIFSIVNGQPHKSQSPICLAVLAMARILYLLYTLGFDPSVKLHRSNHVPNYLIFSLILYCRSQPKLLSIT